MRVTHANMAALMGALERLFELDIGEENLGFWLENHGEPYADREEIAEARAAVTESLPDLRAACVKIIDIIDGKSR